MQHEIQRKKIKPLKNQGFLNAADRNRTGLNSFLYFIDFSGFSIEHA